VKTSIGMAFLLVMGFGGHVWAGPDTTNQVAPALCLELNLRDGSRLVGAPAIASIPMQTSYARMDIPLKQVFTLALEDGDEGASLSLLNGDKLKGGIRLDSITLETVFGKVTIGVEHIRLLRALPTGRDGLMTNLACNAKVEVNRTAPGNGMPEKANDSVTHDVDQPGSYWFPGEGAPQPDWIRLRFDHPAVISSFRILVPVGTARFNNGHAPLDYEVIGFSRSQEVVLASVRDGKHPQTEDGPIAGVKWIVVKLGDAQLLDGVQLRCSRTSGANYGPVIFEIQALGRR
jgi:hypothetical protein